MWECDKLSKWPKHVTPTEFRSFYLRVFINIALLTEFANLWFHQFILQLPTLRNGLITEN